MSPEKLVDGNEDHKGDIFSLGVTLYELLTGKKPFQHSKDDDDDIQEIRDQSPVVDPHEIRSEISSKLSHFVASMMSHDADDRPGYDTIIAELKEFQKKYKKYEKKFFYQLISKHL